MRCKVLAFNLDTWHYHGRVLGDRSTPEPKRKLGSANARIFYWGVGGSQFVCKYQTRYAINMSLFKKLFKKFELKGKKKPKEKYICLWVE